ncbi:MAG: hypothetical protein A2138_26830 [Deltaproteobacteria bacterium RBG_16_71_12]|nr:MAG: hypothetical protein A2138_26830 [Deltaproteobacteria bacterium RBG_16_71_12]
MLAALPVLVLAAACPAEVDCAPARSEVDGEVDDEDVVYGGLGNDEVWLTLYDAKGRAEAGGKAARVLVPAQDQALPQDALPTFEWESDLKLALGPERPAPLSPPRARSPLEPLSRLLIPNAYAPLPPVTSDAYLLEIAVPGLPCPRSIVTTGLLHTLDEATWAALKTAIGQELTLTVWSAYLSTGVPTEGPFVSDPVTFRVE